MRVFAASLAAASAPIFGLWSLQTDLASASKNTYGDVAVHPRAVLAGKGTLVRCGAWCRLGSGWLAFSEPSRLTRADVASATAAVTKREGWFVRLQLTSAGRGRWDAFVRELRRNARLRGVPDVVVVVGGGQVAALPFASQVAATSGVVTLTGFSKPGALKLASLLKR
jgi:hypothetical protein